MKWISVKDKFPDDLEKEIPEKFCSCDGVLVMAEISSTGPSPLIGIAIREDSEWIILGDQGTHMDTGFYKLVSEDITHWMPIP